METVKVRCSVCDKVHDVDVSLFFEIVMCDNCGADMKPMINEVQCM